MTEESSLPPQAFAVTAEAIAATERVLDTLRARAQAEAMVMRLRIVNAVNDVVAQLREEALGGLGE